MARIFVTRQIPGAALEELKTAHEVDVFEGRVDREDLLKRVRGVEAILSTVSEKIDQEVIDAAGSGLKIIANYAVGYDNIDVAEATKRGIMVTNTPSALGDAVAEFTVALVLALSRRVVEADKFMRASKFTGWDPNLFLGLDLTGKTLGVIGPGVIGSVVGKRLQAVFDMELVYYCRNRKEAFEAETGGRCVPLEELLRIADVVTVHVPLAPETRHLIGTRELALMKPTAILINTARGPIVEEKALRVALENKRLWGAALDVFEVEDARAAASLRDLSNVILTPHIASATLQAREEMTRLAVDNIMAALSGKQPINRVND
jgi:glyoxylate reductase